MQGLGDFTAIRVNGEEISLHDLLSAAKFGGDLDFIAEAVNRTLVRAAAARLGIAVSDEELQQESDGFRAACKLYAAQATLDWLAANHLAQEDWEYALEDEILARKLRKVFCAAKVDQHFAENKHGFDAATVSLFLVPDEDVARELKAQCMDDKVPFHELARQFPETRTIGKLRRNQMERMLAAAIFGVQPGEVAGPVRTERGWCLVLVEALHPAELDEATRAEIERALFEDWLQEERRKAKIETPLLTEL